MLILLDRQRNKSFQKFLTQNNVVTKRIQTSASQLIITKKNEGLAVRWENLIKRINCMRLPQAKSAMELPVVGNITLSERWACANWKKIGTPISTVVFMYRMKPRLPRRKNRSVKKVRLIVAHKAFLIYILERKWME